MEEWRNRFHAASERVETLVEKFLDVWTVWPLGLGDGASLFKRARSIGKLSSQHLQVNVTLVAQRRVGRGEFSGAQGPREVFHAGLRTVGNLGFRLRIVSGGLMLKGNRRRGDGVGQQWLSVDWK